VTALTESELARVRTILERHASKDGLLTATACKDAGYQVAADVNVLLAARMHKRAMMMDRPLSVDDVMLSIVRADVDGPQICATCGKRHWSFYGCFTGAAK